MAEDGPVKKQARLGRFSESREDLTAQDLEFATAQALKSRHSLVSHRFHATTPEAELVPLETAIGAAMLPVKDPQASGRFGGRLGGRPPVPHEDTRGVAGGEGSSRLQPGQKKAAG